MLLWVRIGDFSGHRRTIHKERIVSPAANKHRKEHKLHLPYEDSIRVVLIGKTLFVLIRENDGNASGDKSPTGTTASRTLVAHSDLTGGRTIATK